jgi:hypothetical protein
MTSQEFVIWLKGFTEGVHEYNITPKQWDLLKEKLGQVIGDDNKFIEEPYSGTPIGVGGWGIPNHDLVNRETSIPTVWRLSSLSGSIETSGSSTITVSSGSTVNGHTTYLYPNGTSVSYTTTGGPTWYSINKIENDSREK